MDVTTGVWMLGVIAASLTYWDGEWLLPLNMEGEPCPFPLEPLLWPKNSPIGMYHCPYCGDMVVAGLPHGDWRNVDDAEIPLAGPIDGSAHPEDFF